MGTRQSKTADRDWRTLFVLETCLCLWNMVPWGRSGQWLERKRPVGVMVEIRRISEGWVGDLKALWGVHYKVECWRKPPDLMVSVPGGEWTEQMLSGSNTGRKTWSLSLPRKLRVAQSTHVMRDEPVQIYKVADGGQSYTWRLTTKLKTGNSTVRMEDTGKDSGVVAMAACYQGFDPAAYLQYNYTPPRADFGRTDSIVPWKLACLHRAFTEGKETDQRNLLVHLLIFFYILKICVNLIFGAKNLVSSQLFFCLLFFWNVRVEENARWSLTSVFSSSLDRKCLCLLHNKKRNTVIKITMYKQEPEKL